MAFQRQLSAQPIQQASLGPSNRTKSPLDQRPGFGNQAMQRVLQSRMIQTKLKISEPGDLHEQEADRMADEVMRMSEGHEMKSGQDETTTPAVEIQRMCRECEDEDVQLKAIDEDEPLQAKEIPGQIPRISANVHQQITALRGGGDPMPAAARKFFEPRFGYDFSHVRIHTNESSTKAVNALAYTTGRDIVFGAGQYSPHTQSGKKLLAHELAHVIQQSNGASHNELQRQSQTRCNPPESNPCPEPRFNVVLEAFRTGSNFLANARNRMSGYVNAPAAGANQLAARALRRHFRWTEAIRQQLTYPDIPAIVLQTIDNSLVNIQSPIGADCPATTPPSDRDGAVLHARSPSTWSGSNCYIFYPGFFAGRNASANRRRGKTAVHEMMHRWEGMSDTAYEFESTYPLQPRAAQNNADSFAALIRDLGAAGS